jgi:hypothetical protein
MASDAFGPTQLAVLHAMRADKNQEVQISTLFAMVCPGQIPGTPRQNQQRLGPFLARLNRKFVRLGVPERIRPGKTRNTYKLWKSDALYIKWREKSV